MSEKKKHSENLFSWFLVTSLVGAIVGCIFLLVVQVMKLLNFIKNYPGVAIVIILLSFAILVVSAFFLLGFLLPRLFAPQIKLKLKECESNE